MVAKAATADAALAGDLGAGQPDPVGDRDLAVDPLTHSTGWVAALPASVMLPRMFAATGDRKRPVVALLMLAVVTSAVADLHCCR